MKEFEIWLEGYMAQENEGVPVKATRFLRYGETDSKWVAETFPEAIEAALKEKGWDMGYYNPKNNSYWACGFYDNEADARKSFG